MIHIRGNRHSLVEEGPSTSEQLRGRDWGWDACETMMHTQGNRRSLVGEEPSASEQLA